MRFLIATLSLVFSLAAWGQPQTIAFWAQNDNALPGGGFGFTPGSFPQDADVGAGVLFLEDFLETIDADGAYTTVQSFGGTTLNALPGFPSGGSLSPQGGAGSANNGMSILLLIDTSGFDNIAVSWAQRGTSTGFDSRQLAWSVDGENFTDFGTDAGVLGSSWAVRTYDLAAINEINHQSTVYFRITLDGATSGTGNNRFDNILITGTEAGSPELFPVLDSDFSTDPFDQGWTAISVSGAQRWQWSSRFQNVSMSAFSSGCQLNEDWLISPAIDFDANNGERLLFDIARGFPGDNDLEVVYSTEWSGSGDPNQVSWNTLTFISSDEFAGNNSPQPFGPFDELQTLDGIGNVAFRFVYAGVGECATWRVESFTLLAEGSDAPPVAFACGNDVTRIHEVQGPGFASPIQGQPVQVEAIVVGAFQSTANGGLGGFFLQEADANQDDDALSSEGIFVFDNAFGIPVVPGDVVRVAGTVTEFFGETQIAEVENLAVCDSGRLTDTSPVLLELPVEDLIQYEAIEGMWIQTVQELTVTDVFNAVRFGEVQVSNGRLFQPTQIVEPGLPAQALQAANDLNRIIIDDARNGSNRLPFINGGDNESELAADNPIRNGFGVAPGFEAVMSFAFSRYRLQPLSQPTFVPESNPRPAFPEIGGGGNLRVATYNVENLFTTLSGPGSQCGPNLLSCRGASTDSELERQLSKTVAAIQAMDADVLALIEIENDGDDRTLQRLVDELNLVDAIGDWRFVPTGFVGTDAIKPAFIYRATRVQPEGHFAVLDQTVDLRFDATRQRPALAQTFRAWNSGKFTAVAVHLRAKSCGGASGPNADQGDGQGCWNLWRSLSTAALVDWLDTDPTGSGDPDFLILGDFNAYAQEDPMLILEQSGFVNLGTAAADGNPALYSFTFFGQAGALDHAMASPTLADQLMDAVYWAINADEIPAFNYSEGLLTGGLVERPDSFFNVDPFRSSDHDPLIIELDLMPCAPGFDNRPQHPRGRILPLPNC